MFYLDFYLITVLQIHFLIFDVKLHAYYISWGVCGMSHPLPVVIGQSSDSMWSDYIEYASIISSVYAPEKCSYTKVTLEETRTPTLSSHGMRSKRLISQSCTDVNAHL